MESNDFISFLACTALLYQATDTTIINVMAVLEQYLVLIEKEYRIAGKFSGENVWRIYFF